MLRKRLRRARTAVVAAALVSLTAGALAVTPLGETPDEFRLGAFDLGET